MEKKKKVGFFFLRKMMMVMTMAFQERLSLFSIYFSLCVSALELKRPKKKKTGYKIAARKDKREGGRNKKGGGDLLPSPTPLLSLSLSSLSVPVCLLHQPASLSTYRPHPSSAAAPEMISMSSVVIDACLLLLYVSVSCARISVAFFVEFSIADMRAAFSEQPFSKSAL